MGLNLEQKQAVVAEVSEQVSRAQAIVLAEYRGLAVGNMTELRRLAKLYGIPATGRGKTELIAALAGWLAQPETVRRLAHKLKGSCLNVGATKMAALSRSLEDPGVRAAVIDKDRNPRWSPARIEDVTPQIIARYFAPRGPDELTFPNTNARAEQ